MAPLYPNIKISLSTLNGNAFVILGACIKNMKKADFTKDQIENFKNEATSGDYDHLLQTVMKYFTTI